jgi:UDP-2,4-diacetamido-2,4,6-trideoxy-beta-L-altropyranose hydrolase
MLDDDFTISFFCLAIPDSLKNEVTDEGWKVTMLETENEFEEYLLGDEIVVLDGYQFDSEYQKKIKEKGSKLVCIDDFHDQFFYADLVINHAPGVYKEDYKGESYTKYLLGPDYALLRPEFLETVPDKRIDRNRNVKNIFICFGGSDSKSLTAKVLSWLPSKGHSITIVIGDAYSHQDELNEVIKERKDFEINVKNSLSAKEMRLELEYSDLAIVPASGILFEVLSIGLPVISGYYTDNQMAIYSGFLEEEVFFDGKSFSKKSFNEALIKVENLDLCTFVRKQNKLIDGNTAVRINKNFLELC